MKSSNKSAPNDDSIYDLHQDGPNITLKNEIRDDSRIVNKTAAVRLTKVKTRGKKGKAIKENDEIQMQPNSDDDEAMSVNLNSSHEDNRSPNKDASDQKLTRKGTRPQEKSQVVVVQAQDAEIAEMEDEDFTDDDYE